MSSTKEKDIVDGRYGEWEFLNDCCDSPDELTSRMKVPGGWMYKTVFIGGGDAAQFSVSMVFVPEVVRVEGTSNDAR